MLWYCTHYPTICPHHGQGWWNPLNTTPHPQAPRLEDSVEAQYDEYLLLLQERNRIIKRIKEKRPSEIETEKREQGFSLYCNGANTAAQAKRVRAANAQKTLRTASRDSSGTQRLQSPQAPVAGGNGGDGGNGETATPGDAGSPQRRNRPRRNWQASPALSIKTSEGDAVILDAPR